jgi:hypothetical protein
MRLHELLWRLHIERHVWPLVVIVSEKCISALFYESQIRCFAGRAPKLLAAQSVIERLDESLLVFLVQARGAVRCPLCAARH